MRTYERRSRSHRARPHAFLSIALAAAAAAAFGCADSPTAIDQPLPEPAFHHSPGHGGGGGGGGGGSAPDASVLLPAPSGNDGLFADGAPYTIPFDTDQMSLIVQDCSRPFVLQRPAEWTVVEGDEIHCSNKSGFSRLDLNDIGSCSDLTSGCDIGTNGHDPSQGFNDDLNYYFGVDTGRRGKGSFHPYNVVWTDGHATVLGTEDVDEDGEGDGITPCRWQLLASDAEFWDGATGEQVDDIRPMALDVVVERQDLACP